MSDFNYQKCQARQYCLFANDLEFRSYKQELFNSISLIYPIFIYSKRMHPNTQQIKSTWNGFASGYNHIDSSMQTFYYTLVHILNIKEAKHILEVACGTGKLLPYALSLKQEQATYLATDLCENMVELARNNIQAYLQKLGSKDSAEEWIARQKLTLRAVDGAEPIQYHYKFDRIIANLVLMIVQDPVKMMKNLYNMAEEGCLLGVTIWGDAQKSNFMTLPLLALKAKGQQLPNVRSNFHLFNKLHQLAAQSGWQLVIKWEQNAPLSSIQIDNSLMGMINFISKGDQFVKQFVIEKTKQIFAEKKILNFPVQMAVFRKK